jgi:hypothetical protein
MQIAVVRWIKATRLINSLLGDQIHREVVSRALPVLEILIAAGAVSWEEDVHLVWASFRKRQEEDTLSTELLDLLTDLVPRLPAPVLTALFDRIHDDVMGIPDPTPTMVEIVVEPPANREEVESKVGAGVPIVPGATGPGATGVATEEGDGEEGGAGVGGGGGLWVWRRAVA